mgnify:CR=1 FL=1
MSFNVNLNGKNYSATLPRRFEKREWLAKYKEYLVKLLLKLKEVRPTQAAPLKKESVYLKVKITSEASSHHSG